jgi:hypothetical protein
MTKEIKWTRTAAKNELKFKPQTPHGERGFGE